LAIQTTVVVTPYAGKSTYSKKREDRRDIHTGFHRNCHFGPMNRCTKSSRKNAHLRLAGEERLSFFLSLSNALLRSKFIESVVVLWLNENLQKNDQTLTGSLPNELTI
jgi:hypothetical protein